MSGISIRHPGIWCDIETFSEVTKVNCKILNIAFEVLHQIQFNWLGYIGYSREYKISFCKWLLLLMRNPGLNSIANNNSRNFPYKLRNPLHIVSCCSTVYSSAFHSVSLYKYPGGGTAGIVHPLLHFWYYSGCKGCISLAKKGTRTKEFLENF